MRIELKKFGDILTSREAGREALLAFSPTLKSLDENEEIVIDFQGVSVLTPSWADEFIRPILFLKKYTEKVTVINDSNVSVQAALRFANPKLNLKKIRVFEDKIAFDEVDDEKIYSGNRVLQVLMFPENDEDALRILIKNKVKEISVHPVDALKNTRLKTVINMLNQAGIKIANMRDLI
ncbi:STAS-like domain-containing protein [Candidatus Peregrinibacteria bacterium]|nr:STAS-like domain-containing protein [Candidatus Peregrinibacteria bacterium]